jgi:hypothetical protein
LNSRLCTWHSTAWATPAVLNKITLSNGCQFDRQEYSVFVFLYWLLLLIFSSHLSLFFVSEISGHLSWNDNDNFLVGCSSLCSHYNYPFSVMYLQIFQYCHLGFKSFLNCAHPWQVFWGVVGI